MQDTYRVTVVRLFGDEETGPQREVLFEAASVNRASLARFAPLEVATALGAEFGPIIDNLSEVPAAWTHDSRDDAAEAPKRKRRTKAEMEADKAREVASAAPAAVDQPAEAPPAEAPPAEAPPAEAPVYNPFASRP